MKNILRISLILFFVVINFPIYGQTNTNPCLQEKDICIGWASAYLSLDIGSANTTHDIFLAWATYYVSSDSCNDAYETCLDNLGPGGGAHT